MLAVPTGLRRHSLLTVSVAIAILASVLAVLPSALAAPPPNYISGNACLGGPNPRWQSGDTWIMYGNVTVPVGCILTIEPGAFIKADPAVHLYVAGQLQANGTAVSPISFDTNGTGVPWTWGGIEIQKTARVSFLQYANLHMVDRGVRALQNPLFWGPTLSHLNIDHAVVGVDFQGSNASLSWSRINYTTMGVQASEGGFGGYPIIVANTITTVSANPAIGIYATNLVQPTIQSNWITWVNGTNGANGGTILTAGKDGGSAVGILVVGGNAPIVAGNTVSQILGGRGGTGGSPLLGGTGGRGGKGGDASGIVMANSQASRAQTNGITGVLGGHGGNGGAGNGLGSNGGPGGAGGTAIAMEAVNSTLSGWWFYNDAIGVTGGSAGDGGSLGGLGGVQGAGGSGGAAYGHFFLQIAAANASNNLAQTLRGGYGGNGTVGGRGGEVGGVWLGGIGGSAILGSNTITTLTGGQGGASGQPVAAGGNATAILAIGDGRVYNLTTIRNNQITSITGGVGGVGGRGGSVGGGATGIGAIYVQLASSGNTLNSIVGGQGGSTGPTFTNGQGGSATGFASAFVALSTSARDRLQAITKGAPGTGGLAPPPTNGVGLYLLGNSTFTSVLSLTNDTFASMGEYDLFLENYSRTTALNTTFGPTGLAPTFLYIGPAANLTIKNFLAVKAFWPNNVTPVSRVVVTVMDGATTVFNRPIPTGSVQWIAVTNRVYVDSPTPTWNATQASVAFGSYTFANNPRGVNLTASQTQYFRMVDTTAPLSSAGSLPPWTGTRSFSVHFTYSDGNGTGVSNVTLWYNLNNTGWVQSAIQVVSSSGNGAFSFTAPSDGSYQFATTAYDIAGNHPVFPPVANNTWTIVDTSIPASQVNALPTWQRSLSFTVSWGPAPGVTDIASYAVQYQHGAGWVTWLGDTTATSATFDITALGIASPQGVYSFRTLARSFAGLTETKTGNDTWTIVDTVVPGSAVATLPPYLTSASFGITWGAAAGTTDIGSVAVQVSTDGGSWTTWFSGATNSSATFTGQDGHRYAFRSLATDFAGNVETKSGNDTWTLVDLTPPSSRVGALPAFESTAAFGVDWAPSAGVADIATFAVQISADNGPWATWFSGATNRSATFAGRDGHRYAFRSLATDNAGNLEAKSGNDTSTVVDTTAPFVVSDAPEGAGVNATLTVVVSFSEPMNQLSVEQAFSIAPAMNGNFSWSPGGSMMTFTPSRALQPGTLYVINVDTRATDRAGNALAAPRSFSFTTIGSPGGGSSSLSIDPLWLLLAVVAVVGAALAIFLMRRRSAGETTAAEAPKPAATAVPSTGTEIDDVFLLYKDGILIKHETLRLRPDIDTDILSGMLTAVQQFVKDSFQSEDEGELNEITVGQMHLHIGRGKWLILAARVAGGDVATMNEQIRKSIQDMEDHHWDQLEDWDGDMALSKVLGPYLKKLIRGDYA